MRKSHIAFLLVVLAAVAGTGYAQTVPKAVVDSSWFRAQFGDNTQFGSPTYIGAFGQTNSLNGWGLFGTSGINGGRAGGFLSNLPGASALTAHRNLALWALGANGLSGINIGLEVGSNIFATSGLPGRAIQVDSGDVYLGRSLANGGPVNSTYVNILALDGPLQAAGSAGTSGQLLVSTGASTAPTWQDAGTALNLSAWLLNGNSVAALKTLGTTSNFDLPFITNNTERMRILASNGNVGINTTNPSQPLEVKGNALLSTSGGVASQLQFQNPAATKVSTFAAGAQTVDLNYTLPATTPNANDMLTSSGGASSQLQWTSASGLLAGNFVQYNVTTTQNMAVLGASNYLYDVNYAASAGSNNALGARVTSTSGTGAATNATGLTVSSVANGAGTSTALTVSATGGTTDYAALFTNGRVGIGTSTPGQQLEVGASGNILLSNTNNTAGQLQLQGTGAGITTFQAGAQGAGNINYTLPTAAPASSGFVLASTTGGVMSWADPIANAWRLTGNTGTNANTNFIGTTDAQAFIVKTNGVVRLRVANADSLRFGINGSAAVTPPSAFTIGSAGWTLASTSNDQTGTDLIVQAGPGTGNSATNGNVIFQTPAAGVSGTTPQTLTERVRISTAGNVGIGTNAPGQLLDVKGNIRLLSVAGPAASQLQFQNPAATFATTFAAGAQAANLNYTLPITTPNLNDVLVSAGGASSALLWTSASNLLSGAFVQYNVTATQAGATLGATNYLFDVNYAASASTNNSLGARVTSTSGTGGATNANGLTISSVANGAGASTALSVSATGGTTDYAAIFTNGRVGIGTSTPTQLLEVKSGNVLLSNGGVATQLQFQGTSTGITTFQAGAQGASNINYTLPTAAPASSGFVLASTTGGVMSWADPIANAWRLTGNTGTNANTNFIGTTDAQAFIVKTNGTVRLRVANADSLRFGINGSAAVTPPSAFTLGAAGWTLASTSNDQTGTDLIVQAGPGTGNNVTNGNVIFQTSPAGASGTTVQTPAERMRITPAGKVGIGNAAPTWTLDVSSSGAQTTAITGARVSNTATSSTASIAKIGVDVQSTGTWNGATATNTGLNVNSTGGTTNTALAVNASAGATNYAATFMGGNVGIGTTTPSFGLDLLNGLGAGVGTLDVARLQDNQTATADNGPELLFAANRLPSAMTNVAAIAGTITDVTNGAYKGALLFSTANNAAPAERMRIAYTGNVGINTSAPSQLLEVKDGNILISNSGTAGQLILKGTGLGTTSINSGAMGATNLTYTLPLTAPAANDLLTSGGGASSQLGWTSVNTLLNGSFVEYNITSTQNVAPLAALNYLYDVAYVPAASTNNATGARITSVSGTTGATNATGLTLVATANGAGTSTALNVTAGGGTTNYAALFNGGNVGVGTATPAWPLDVSNASAQTSTFTLERVNNLATSSTASITKTAVDIQSTGTWNGASAVNTGLNVSVSGGTTNYAGLFMGGNVGMGTTTPSYPLDILTLAGGGTVDVLRLQNNIPAADNSGAEMLFAANRSGSGMTNIAAVAGVITDKTQGAYKGALVFSTANNGAPAERMRIDNAGNVGIGTSAPGQLLEVKNGNILLSGSAGQLQMQGTSTGITTLVAGAQGATNLTYTFPITTPNASDVLTSSGGTSSALQWTSASSLLSGNFVQYNITSTQNGATLGATNYLFDLNYAASASSNNSLGARVTSTSGTGAATNATGLTVSSVANGAGTSTALSVSATGGASNYAAIFTNGRVGVGTSAPTQLLEVKSGNVLLSNAGAATQLQFQGTGSGITTFQAGAQGANSFNYTLPTTAPNLNDILISGGGAASQLNWVNANTLLSGSFVKYDVTTAQNGSATRTDNLFNVAYAAGANDANAAGALITSVGGTTSRNATGLSVVATATGAGTSTALSVTAGGGTTNYAALFSGGNVGVGTATPAWPLDVSSAAAQTTAFTLARVNNLATSSTGSINKIGLDIQSTGTWNGASAVNTGLNVNVGNGTTNYAALFSGGNVGIGTTTPSVLLDIVGSGSGKLDLVYLENNATAAVNNGSEIMFSTNRSPSTMTNIASIAGVITNISAGGYLGAMVFSTANNGAPVERARIDNTGNFGVGVVVPGQKLDVAGNVQFTQALMPNSLPGSSGNVLVSQGANTAPIWQTPATALSGTAWLLGGNVVASAQTLGTMANFDLPIVTNSTEKMRVMANGNVGIGNAAPAGLLDVSVATSGTPSLTGRYVSLSASTFTDNTTAANNSAPSMAFNSIAQPTLVATNGNVTTPSVYTMYIAGAPIKGGNEALTNSVALGIAAGAVGASVTNAYGLQVVAPTGATNNYAASLAGNTLIASTGATANQLQFQGTSTGISTFKAGAQGASTINYTLPTAQGAASTNTVLTNDGTGTLSWALPSPSTITNGTNSPSAYAANQNNLTVVTATATIYRISSSSNIDITGIDATGVTDGRQITFVNVGTNTIRFMNLSGSSSAGNQIITNSSGANEQIGANDHVTFWYDGTSTKWRLMSKNY